MILSNEDIIKYVAYFYTFKLDLKGILKDIPIETKTPNIKDTKLNTDVAINDYLIERMFDLDNYNILSEERDFIDSNSEYTWIIDPLDGSFNFQMGIPFFCLSIALWDRSLNNPIFGCVIDYNTWDLYYNDNTTSFLNGSPIVVSKIKSKEQSVLSTGFSTYMNSDNYGEGLISTFRNYKKVRLLGSAAMSLCYLARGSVDAYCESDLKIWDAAAGIPIVQKAGGSIKFVKSSNNKIDVNGNNGFEDIQIN